MTEILSTEISPEVEHRIARILQAACSRHVSLATAESCTGGLIASLMTDVSGCSHAFECGFVTYSDEAKHRMLGIDPRILKTHGAVSETVARAMASGALGRSAAHFAVAVTGFAGPSEDGEEGLVHFACASRGGAIRHHMRRFGAIGRGRIRGACIDMAAGMFEDALAR